jgi:CRP/FNR family transcriptional regulator
MYSQTAASVSRRPTVCFAAAADDNALNDLFKGQRTETFCAGETLFCEGDLAWHTFVVLEGMLRAYRIMSDGRRAIIGFIHPGDVLGASLQNQYLFSAETVTDVKVRRLTRGRFFATINESPALRPQFFAILSDEMSASHDQIAQDQMLQLGRKTAGGITIATLQRPASIACPTAS